MDREILFRAKFGNDWKYGYLSVEPKGLVIKEPYELNQSNIWHIIPETVGQYTGLTDKNGTKIFEGDIVVCKQSINGNFISECIEIGYVEMKHGAFGLHRKQGYYRPFKDWLEDYDYEVIGTIHDNLELLK